MLQGVPPSPYNAGSIRIGRRCFSPPPKWSILLYALNGAGNSIALYLYLVFVAISGWPLKIATHTKNGLQANKEKHEKSRKRRKNRASCKQRGGINITPFSTLLHAPSSQLCANKFKVRFSVFCYFLESEPAGLWNGWIVLVGNQQRAN